MKKCNTCGILKNKSEYSKKSSKLDGLSGKCKECVKIQSRKYYLNNIEKIKQRDILYCKNNREKINERNRKRYALNIDIITEKQRERYKTDEYKIARKIRKHKRRILEKDTENDGSITKSSLLELLVKQDNKCGYCGTDISNGNSCHLDHIIPISRGGGHILSNVHFTCAKCNLSKGCKSQEEFLRSSPKQ